MIASSVFVLAALTMTGIYMKESSLQSEDDGYTLDFTALDDSAGEKYQEIAQNNQQIEEQPENSIANYTENNTAVLPESVGDDLDYMPLEVDSTDIEIPGLTEEEADLEPQMAEEVKEPVSVSNATTEKTLSFSEDRGLTKPVGGEILMHYSMGSSVYFATLDQYKYNPAVLFRADAGTGVNVCAEGRVLDIYEDEEIGKAVTLDLGNRYQATYGQLSDIKVSEGTYVEEGDMLASVAAPTKYYSVEGSNLYFQLTKDGNAVNPEGLFR